MFEPSIPDKSFIQICIVVDDVERYAANYRSILGFDMPHDYLITENFAHTKSLYYGKPMDARAKISSINLGKVSFELLQPLDDGSIWMDYLKKHGPGLQHVTFNAPRTAPAVAHFADHGYQVTQQGLFTGRSGMYTNLDTDKDLGVVIELLEFYNEGTPPQSTPFPTDKGLGTDIVMQVGLVTNDIDATAQRYRAVLGLPEPNWVQTPGYAVTETRFYGQPSQATARLAFFDFGQAQLELIQPDTVPSVWRNYLNEKGESAHHIAFVVRDTQQAVDHFAKHGIGVAQQAYYGDRSGMYTYMDSEAQLGVIFELLENFPQPR